MKAGMDILKELEEFYMLEKETEKTEVCYEKANEEKRVVIYCRESRDDSKNIRRNLRHKIEEGYLPK